MGTIAKPATNQQQVEEVNSYLQGNTPKPPHSTLRKRVDVTFGTTSGFTYPHQYDEDVEHWSIRLTHFAATVPIEFAAETLDRFYTFAMDAVDTFIGRGLEDMRDFTLRLGNVVLEIFCRDFICWNIAHEFLEQMRRLTENGGPAGRYEGHVVNVATHYTMFVRLKIWPGRSGPEA